MSKAKVEPLHIMNLDWQRWNHGVLPDATYAATLGKAKTAYQLPDEAPFPQYLLIQAKISVLASCSTKLVGGF